MKMRRESLILVLLFLVGIFSIPVELPNASTDFQLSFLADDTISYIPHGHIVINSNDGFTLWPGNGTKVSPYIIENLSIKYDTYACIEIYNTDAFFIIRNCSLTGNNVVGEASGTCIYLVNVTNGIIDDCVMFSKGVGIEMRGSKNCSLTNNLAYFMDDEAGFSITGSAYIDFINNSAIDGNGLASGIEFLYSSHCRLINNYARNNTCLGGIYLFDCVNFTLIDNVLEMGGLLVSGPEKAHWIHDVSGTLLDGKPLGYLVNMTSATVDASSYSELILVNCNDTDIHGGDFLDGTFGLAMSYCTNCIIHDNRAGFTWDYAWHEYCFYFQDLSNCSIYQNEAYSSPGYGFYLMDSSDTLLDNNLATNKDYSGFFVSGSENCNMTNVEADTCQTGISYQDSSLSYIMHNTIHNNWQASFIDTCVECHIIDCSFMNDDYGLNMDSSINCTIDTCEISSSWNGIYIDSSNGINVTKNVLDYNSQSGIVISSSESCRVEDNEACFNDAHGISLVDSSICIVQKNTVSDNLKNGIFVEGSYIGNNSFYYNTAERNHDNGFRTNFIHKGITFIGNIARDNTNNGFHLRSYQSDTILTIIDNVADSNGDHGFYFDHIYNGPVVNNSALDNGGIGIFAEGCRWLELYYNKVGWNLGGNAVDEDGENNQWDDGINTGNVWGDFTGGALYIITGTTGAHDNYPSKLDTTSPIINSPPDIYTYEGDGPKYIIWTPSEPHPWRYSIFRNSSNIVGPKDWDGSPITYITVDLPFGTYEFLIVIYDTCNNNATDIVMVYVDDVIFPSPGGPNDIQYAQGTTGHNITWVPDEKNPASYEVFQDGVSIFSGDWNGSSITIGIDGLPIGSFNYTLVLCDLAGNLADDTVWVTVYDNITPTINSPADFIMQQGTSHYITWIGFDLNPLSYLILLDGLTFSAGSWNASSETLSCQLDVFGAGQYNLTIVLTDISGNQISDSVIITIVDDQTAPEIPPLDDVAYPEEALPLVIEWCPSDEYPISYSISYNGSEIESGYWDGSFISLTLDNLSLGSHVFLLIVTDIGGNQASEEIILTILDLVYPTLSQPSDLSYLVGATGNFIEWNAYDKHPSSYIVYLDDVPVLSGTWSDTNQTFALEVDGLHVGTHSYKLMVFDMSGNSISDIVVVTVSDISISTSTTSTTSIVDNSLVLLGILGGLGVTCFVLVYFLIIKRKQLLPAGSVE